MDFPDLKTRTDPPLRRRNSIATTVLVPAKLTLPTKPQHSGAVDFELISIKPPSYTSLKDLLPATALNSPTGSVSSGTEISIRNRLVKLAAGAYLRPTSASPGSSGRHILHRIWDGLCSDLVKNSVAAFFGFVSGVISRVLDRILRAVRVRSTR
ncbi:hypothetical protein NMG60_11001533 [Bertholletia excelsa]